MPQSEPVSRETAELIKSAVPVLQAHGEAITTKMYENIFEEAPDAMRYFSLEFQAYLKKNNKEKGNSTTAASASLCPFETKEEPRDGFPMAAMEGTSKSASSTSSQAGRLAATLIAYCANIDEVEKIGNEVQRICQTHVMRGIRAPHYALVGVALLKAIKQVLSEAATPELLTAFGEAYELLADIFIEEETRMRKELRDKPGGWDGFRGFKVVKRTDAGKITKITIEPIDGQSVIKSIPGQCIGLRWNDPDYGLISKTFPLEVPAPPLQGKHYVFSLQEVAPTKVISSVELLLDRAGEGFLLEATPPTGGFMFKDNDNLQKRLASHSVRDHAACPMSSGGGAPVLQRSLLSKSVGHGDDGPPPRALGSGRMGVKGNIESPRKISEEMSLVKKRIPSLKKESSPGTPVSETDAKQSPSFSDSDDDLDVKPHPKSANAAKRLMNMKAGSTRVSGDQSPMISQRISALRGLPPMELTSSPCATPRTGDEETQKISPLRL